MSKRERLDEETERTSVTLTRSLARRLTYQAEATETSASAIVRDALQKYFADQPKRATPKFVGLGHSGSGDIASRDEQIIGELIDERFKDPTARDR